MQTLIGISGRMGSGKDTVAKMIQYVLHARATNDTDDLRLDSSRNYGPSSGWEVQRFAQNVKKIASLLTGVPESSFESQDFKAQTMPEIWDHSRPAFAPDVEIDLVFNGDEAAARRAGWEIIGPDVKPRTWKLPRTQPMTYRELLQKIGTDAMRDHVHQNVWVNSLLQEYDAAHERREVDEGFSPIVTSRKWLISDMRFPNEFEAIKSRGGITLRVERPREESNAPVHVSETALDGAVFDYIIHNDGDILQLLHKVSLFVSYYELA